MHVFLPLVRVTKVELHTCLLTKSQLKLNQQHDSNCMLSRRLDIPVFNCPSCRVVLWNYGRRIKSKGFERFGFGFLQVICLSLPKKKVQLAFDREFERKRFGIHSRRVLDWFRQLLLNFVSKSNYLFNTFPKEDKKF